ncbi:heavy metal efflux pump, CzcA family [Thioalkalivibrio sulfidiphilus HL-EbGr7]|uniref:Heavy metal efflux pump, CzcA family n=1 Tax=Thioalkalivibrio sulfidiphilus (strain HL-EbGR7) TaxID=396588 RepID=B8GQU0_THISH|nr:CusA/CzcA family heavy metal efflux RND transporter [Thioalkalivibrio sulfidiphilus]ACL74314.1 heavy metal efflux pump, CzcA family [Thioalkalivibrio sulfidiphilus HL-EbGr7]
MLTRLIQFALTQRLFVLLAVALLIGLGILALTRLPIDAFPDVSSPQVKLIIKAPGMTPEEVEARITAPVEVEMLGIPNQVMLRSVAKYGLTDITVDFAEGTDIFWARQQVAERLAGLWGDLPPDVSGGMAPLTTPLGEMFMFTVEGGDLTLAERRALLDWVIRPALRTVPGVADVNALGGYVQTFEVSPDPLRMSARGVTLDELIQALQLNNRNDGAGRLIDGEETLLVRAEGSVRNLEDLGSLLVAWHRGMPVHVHDVATVRMGALTRYGAVTRNGVGETVQGLVLGLRGANAREVVEGVKARLAELAPTLPEGVHLEVFYDRGNLVDRAVHTVSKALVEAIVLVLILLVLFLGDLRAALTVALILPLAALLTFILMDSFGLSANLMSLGGLAIAIGMLVDAAVVVVENIVSQLARAGHTQRLPRLHVIHRAVREVAAPVTAGILIIIIVFLPLLTLEGLEGKLFIPVALTIVFALAGSLLLSLTAIPVLASYVLRRVGHTEPWLVRRLDAGYRPMLAWSMAHPRTVAGTALVALLLAGGLYTQIGKTFMPTMDEGNLIVQLEKLPSISLPASIELDQRVQRALLEQVTEVIGVVARAGSDELGLDPMGLNETDSFLVLRPRSEWRFDSPEQLQDAIRAVLAEFPGVGYAFTQPIEMRVSEMLTGVRGDLAIKLFGPDLDVLNTKAEEIAAAVRTIPGAEDVYFSVNEGVQYLNLAVDREAAARLGLSVDALQTLLRAQVEGKPVGTVYEGMRRTPLVIRGESAMDSPQAFREMLVSLPDGGQVPLSSLARIERVEGPVSVKRELGERNVVVIANVRGRDLVGFVEAARLAVNEAVPLEPGYRLAWGGQFENQQRAAERLGLVVPVAIGLIFLLLFSTFGSVRQAALVLLNIPFALIGGVVGLWLSGEYLSVPASVGFIALLGIAVLNGVVMVSYFNQLRARGMGLDQAVIEGARRRLRPVMMTASIAAFGLVPLLFATGPGSEIQRPLAVVVIGGLATSTLLTLVLMPILYRRFGAPHPREALS